MKFVKGRPIRTKVAKELCETCGCEWDVPVSFDDLVHIEPILNANVYVVGMDQIPLLGDTCNIYNTLLYKSEKKGATQQFWFLYDEHDDGSGHFHAITDIKGFMGVRYFCSKCLGCFTHKKAFDQHVCSEHHDCRGCNTKQKKSSTIGKERAHFLRQKPLLGGKQELDEWIRKPLKSTANHHILIV